MRILRHFSFLVSSNWAVEKVLPDKFLSCGRLDFVGPLSFDTFHQMCFWHQSKRKFWRDLGEMGSWLEEFSFPGLFGMELVFSSNVFLISKQGQI